MNRSRLAQSLNRASRYCKEIQPPKEARLFLDKHMSQIVSSQLERLELGEPDSTEKAAISTCLDSALEVVSNDLAAASKSADVCKSLQVLLDIFDEPGG